MKTVTAEELARAFAKSVNDQLEYHQLKKLLQNPRENPCCVSHDYMDANVNMMEAYQTLAGIGEDDYELMDAMDLFNEAWDLARDNYWYMEDWQTVLRA